MFGLIYSLLMGTVCIIDEIINGVENEQAKNKSISKNGWSIGGNKKYYKGKQARLGYRNGNHVILNNSGKVIEDIDLNNSVYKNEMCKRRFNEDMKSNTREGCFYYIVPYENTEFSKSHPSGYYEKSTLKRIHTITRNGKHYKFYDRTFKNRMLPDYSHQIEINEKEWKSYGANGLDDERR